MAEVTVDEELVYVPGWWICTECAYRTYDTRAAGGTCPNDNAPIEQLTWRQHYDDANEASHHFAKRISNLIEENSELAKRANEAVKLNHQLKDSVNRLAKEAGYVFN